MFLSEIYNAVITGRQVVGTSVKDLSGLHYTIVTVDPNDSGVRVTLSRYDGVTTIVNSVNESIFIWVPCSMSF